MNDLPLFICYTPLHILVVQQIIQSEEIDQFILVYFHDQDTDKNKYYYDVLVDHSQFAIKIKRDKKILNDFFPIYKASRILKKYNTKIQYSIYTANIKSVHTRLLMYFIGYGRLNTFDDGIGNILHTDFFTNDNDTKLSKLFFRLFQPSLLYTNLKKTISKHYTIYNEKNVYPNTYKINLFTSFSNRIDKKSLPIMKIFLSSPFSEVGLINKKNELKLYNHIIEKYKIDKILPHPGEKTKKISTTEYIDTHLIAEEYIYNISKKYNILIYGLYSTALVNISMNIPNVKVTNLHYSPISLDRDLEKFNNMKIQSEFVVLK